MSKYLLINKPIGITPLQAIEDFKKSNPLFSQSTLGFAGRLDPMADGLLLVLIDEENKKRREYEALSKKYTFSVLFGIRTDTYDRLGIMEKVTPHFSTDEIKKHLPTLLQTVPQMKSQTFPPFSSKTVLGKPLYWWARQNKLDEITLPSKPIVISSFSLEKIETLTSLEIGENSISIIEKIKGDFRQDETIIQWKNFIKKYHNSSFPLVTFSITCSSGTYVRGIAHEMGESIGCGAIAHTITRTAIGSYVLERVL